jgi:hypothetical protein
MEVFGHFCIRAEAQIGSPSVELVSKILIRWGRTMADFVDFLRVIGFKIEGAGGIALSPGPTYCGGSCAESLPEKRNGLSPRTSDITQVTFLTSLLEYCIEIMSISKRLDLSKSMIT